MHEPSPLQAWETFYVIVGSSAGALTGLQFVVMTLITQARPARGRGETIAAFGSPNVVHFCAVLLVASILAVPWRTLRVPGLASAACGAAGIVYSIVVLGRARRQQEYRPVFEDWVWHNILPVLAYLALLAAGLDLDTNATDSLYVIAGAALLLVFIGIHNAWDTVTYLATEFAGGPQESGTGGGEQASADSNDSRAGSESVEERARP